MAWPKSISARSVCSGTRPSRYHSIRAISAPPRRPEQLIRMPSAPRRIADCTARFMARRNATRRSSCCAIDSATSVASSSGLRISTMLMTTSEAVMSATRLRSLSISAPFLPITTPGRAEWIVTRHFLCGRSITILATAARCETLHHDALADMGLGHDQIVDLEVMVVFGVGDRGLQALLDVDSDPLARKLQIGKGRRSLPAADQLRDKIELLRAHPKHPGDRLGLVIREAPFALWFAHRLNPQA